MKTHYCPLSLAKRSASIVTPTEGGIEIQPNAAPCMVEKCAWFMARAGEDGQVKEAGCSFVFAAMATVLAANAQVAMAQAQAQQAHLMQLTVETESKPKVCLTTKE